MIMKSEAPGAQAYNQLELSLQNLSQEEAVAKLELFVRDYPEFAQAHNDLGVLEYELGNKLQALGRYERAVRLAPQNLTFRKNLASFYYVELGWIDDAVSSYLELLQQAPADIDVLSALALISRELGRPDEARIFVERIIALEPFNQDAKAMLDALVETNDSPLATPTPPAPQTASISELDQLLTELQQSIAEIDQHRTPAPPQPVQPSLAATDLARQIDALESQLQQDPLNAVVHNDLGVLLFTRGDHSLALAHHELACRYAPDNVSFLKNLAGMYASTDDNFDRAIELLTGALQKYPTDTEILAALGNVSLQVGRPEETLIFLRRVLDLEPWNHEAQSIIAQLQSGAVKDFFLSR